MISLVVDAEDDAGAEKAVVAVGEVGKVVVLGVPEALACEAHALPAHLPNHRLHNDLVGGN